MSGGWFADVDREQAGAYRWQPCLEMDSGCVSFQIWFATREVCEAFIRDEVLPAAGRMADAEGKG